MIQKGDWVELSPLCKRRHWYSNVKHLTGRYLVVAVKGDIITFKTGEKVNHYFNQRSSNNGCRHWHISNLLQVVESLENE